MNKKIKKLFAFVVLSSLLLSCSSTKSLSVSKSGTSSSDFDRNASYLQKSERGTENRMVTYSIELNLLVENTDETKKIILEQVNANNGFIVLETNKSVRARIPVENMDIFTNKTKTLGYIVSETKTGSDITEQYRDNVIRLESLKTVRNRYLELLEKAGTVSDILSIEKELERINSEIELLEGWKKHSELSVAYSDINVRIDAKGEKAKPGPIGWIFVGLYHGVKWLFVWH